MTWFDIVWPMMGGASLALSVTHLLIGLQNPRRPAHLMFSLAAAAIAALSVLELQMMRATTPAVYADLLQLAHMAVAALVIGIVFFLRLHFEAGRAWLAYLTCALRVSVLIPNFTSGANVNFRSIDALEFVSLPGAGDIAVPIGVANPWMLVAQLSNLLLIWFVIDLLLQIRRRGDTATTRRAAVVGGSIVFFVLFSATWAVLMVLNLFEGPWSINVAFFAVVVAMSYELGGDVVRAAALSRRLAESQASLHESEQRLALAAGAARLGMWTWDQASERYWFSDTAHGLLGIAPGNQLDRDGLLASIHPDDRHVLLEALEVANRGDGEYACEFRLAGPGQRCIAAIGGAERSASGETLVIRGVLLDITERRQADQRFRQVIDSAPTAMLVVSQDGSVAFANSRAVKLFGTPLAQLTGLDVETLLPGWAWILDMPNATTSPWPSTLSASRPGAPVLAGHRLDGSALSLEVGVAPVRIGDDAYVVASLTDIGERLRMEQESALQRNELAHLSRVALLGELSGSIAHELNQPLTAVLSNAQAALRFMAHEPPNLAEVHESLVNIVENDKRAAEVIRRLRSMLRKEQPQYQLLDVNEVVLDMLRLINSDILNRDVQVIRELEPGLPGIHGDRVQLQQVLLNLIVNACDAMDDRAEGRVLTVRSQLLDEATIGIAISDVGRGIPGPDLDRIFEPFVTNKSEGIGLGLPICRTILRSHGGSLSASNNPVEGATFNICLPIPR